MTKAKYKVGDHLTIVGNPQDDWSGSDWYYGDSFVVVYVEVHQHCVVYWNWHDDGTGEWPETAKCGVLEGDVELTEIVHSPLYKALK